MFRFVPAIFTARDAGMGLMRMPVFCWTALASNLLMVAAFPVLTATFAMLLDRYLGLHFFSVVSAHQPRLRRGCGTQVPSGPRVSGAATKTAVRTGHVVIPD
jgi:heme/copper-type cytochrome/quinol oxidase subunit 1